MQFQCWIDQHIGNAESSELGADGTNYHGFTFGSLNDEATNHHIVICLNNERVLMLSSLAVGIGVAVGLGVAVAVGLGVA